MASLLLPLLLLLLPGDKRSAAAMHCLASDGPTVNFSNV